MDSLPEGKIFKTNDSGNTWAQSHTNDSEINFFSLVSIGDSIILAGGGNGIIARSSDKGFTWNETKTALNFKLHRMFADKSGKFILAFSNDTSNYLITIDSGKTWKMQNNIGNFKGGYCGVDIIDSVTAYCVFLLDGISYLYSTSDAGNSWIKLYEDNREFLSSICIISPEKIVIGCASGNVIYKHDFVTVSETIPVKNSMNITVKNDLISVSSKNVTPGYYSISVSNINGNCMYKHFEKRFIGSGELDENIPINNLVSGIYFLNIESEAGNTTQKFIISR